MTEPLLRLALGAACLSASPVLMTLADAGPVTMAFYRCVLPLPVLAVLASVEQRQRGRRPPGNRGYAVLAGLFFAANLVLWIHSIADIGAGISTVLSNMQVVFVAAFSWVVLRERPHRRFVAALPVVLLGVVLLSGVTGGANTGAHPAAGVAYGLGTSAAYAVFLLILRRTGVAGHAAGPLLDATAGAAVGALLFGLAFGIRLAIPWPSLGWLLLLAMLSGIVGWLLITSGLPHLPAGLSALVLLLEPAGALILGALVLDQRPSLIQLAGAVLVCGGVLIPAGRAAQRPPSSSAT